MQNPSVYNESQAVAIQSAVDAVCEPYANPRICLLQGPPGTGKTRTICGLIQAVFEVNKLEASLVFCVALNHTVIVRLPVVYLSDSLMLFRRESVC